MLMQRVITAIVLLAVLMLVMSASGPWPFASFMAILCGCAGWEWARLTWPDHPALRIGMGSSLFAFTLAISDSLFVMNHDQATWLRIVVIVTTLVWLLAVPIAVFRAKADAPSRHLGWTLFAPLALIVACALMVYLFSHFGTIYLLSLLTLIWIADIFAYFGG